jgi:hypothetical protein
MTVLVHQKALLPPRLELGLVAPQAGLRDLAEFFVIRVAARGVRLS